MFYIHALYHRVLYVDAIRLFALRGVQTGEL